MYVQHDIRCKWYRVYVPTSNQQPETIATNSEAYQDDLTQGLRLNLKVLLLEVMLVLLLLHLKILLIDIGVFWPSDP